MPRILANQAMTMPCHGRRYPPADYTPAGNLTAILPQLTAIHDARVSKDKDFKLLREDIAEFNAQRKKNLISLNEADRRKEREAQEARILAREKESDAEKGGKAADMKSVAANSAAFEDDGLQSNERNLATDLANEKARKNAKDILLNEAAHILSDEVGLLKSDPKLATHRAAWLDNALMRVSRSVSVAILRSRRRTRLWRDLFARSAMTFDVTSSAAFRMPDSSHSVTCCVTQNPSSKGRSWPAVGCILIAQSHMSAPARASISYSPVGLLRPASNNTGTSGFAGASR